MSASDHRAVVLRGAGERIDDDGRAFPMEARVYLQRSVGWEWPGVEDEAITAVRLCLEIEGWTGGEDAAMTAEQARAVAAMLLDCADRASVDRAGLLAAGRHVTEAPTEVSPCGRR